MINKWKKIRKVQVSVLIDAAARKKKLKLSKWQLELLLGLNKGKVIKNY